MQYPDGIKVDGEAADAILENGILKATMPTLHRKTLKITLNPPSPMLD